MIAVDGRAQRGSSLAKASALQREGSLAERAYLTSAEVAAWPPADAAGCDPALPLREALRANNLFGPLQTAARHSPIGCVALEITQRCNLDCKLCYLSEHSQAVHDLPLDQIYRRIDMIERHYGAGTNVQVTGGDPTLRPRRELIAIVRRVAERGLRPALFTNGIKATRGLLVDLADAGLRDIAFHVDTTQQRPGYASEQALNPVRRTYIERARGLGLHVLFNTTVTGQNLPQVPELIRFFVEHADRVNLASFQLQADTGRSVLRKADPTVTRERLIQRINEGAGVDLGFEYPLIGHPDCNRYTGCLVAGDAVAPLFDDPHLVARVLARTVGRRFDRHDRTALRHACWSIAWRNPGIWPSALRHAGRKLWQLQRGLWRSRGRVRELSFHIHQFMDHDRLERSRCESCVFMVMTQAGPISMCVHNAKRDAFILQPLELSGPGERRTWDPLAERVVRDPAGPAPDPRRYPPKHQKGRTRARAERGGLASG